MYLSRWRLAGNVTAGVLLLLALPAHALAGKNAGGALIVHTDDAVSYTATAEYCGVDLNMPASCGEAITRTDKDENTPAVIWILAAFPEASNPAVTGVQFGVEHNLPQGQGYIERYGPCGVNPMEIPDDGFPDTPGGDVLAFSAATNSPFFPVYWIAAYGTAGSYLSTTTYPGTGTAMFADDSVPAVLDPIERFGRVNWRADGANNCPETTDNIPDGLDYPVQEGDSRFVWAAHIADPVIETRLNRFIDPTYSQTFPVDALMIRSVETTEAPPGISVSAVSLSVDTDGVVSDSLPPQQLRSAPGMRPSLRFALSGEVESRLRSVQVSPEEVLETNQWPGRDIVVVRLADRTAFVDTSRPTVRPIVHGFGIGDPTVSNDGRRLAAATRGGRLVVFAPGGQVERATEASPDSFDQLAFGPSGRTLFYARDPEAGPPILGVFDLESSSMVDLGLTSGFQYYAADGTRMLLIDSSSPGHATYYDMSDPFEPSAIAQYATETMILTAAVSQDGRFVAIQESESGSGQLFRVILLDGALRPLGEPLLTEFTARGLQFEGEFLFVGTQRHPVPAFLSLTTTTDILVFDLSD